MLPACRQQNVADYMDSDEVAELQKTSLQTTADYDTFGSTAAEVAKRQTQQEAEGRPSAIPGAVIEDIIVPVPDSMGEQGEASDCKTALKVSGPQKEGWPCCTCA